MTELNGNVMTKQDESNYKVELFAHTLSATGTTSQSKPRKSGLLRANKKAQGFKTPDSKTGFHEKKNSVETSKLDGWSVLNAFKLKSVQKFKLYFVGSLENDSVFLAYLNHFGQWIDDGLEVELPKSKRYIRALPPLPTTSNLNDWIKLDVNDKNSLPDELETVVFSSKEGDVLSGYLLNGLFRTFSKNFSLEEVLLWMPMPNLPERDVKSTVYGERTA